MCTVQPYFPLLGDSFYDVFSQGSIVLERLKKARIRNVLPQYRKDFRDNAMYQLRVSEVEVGQVLTSSQRALSGEDNSDVVVIAGPAGAGKTRLGYESLLLLEDRSRGVIPVLEKDLGFSIQVVALHIDFNHGFAYNSGVDEADMDENMGVRLAAAALGDTIKNIKFENGGTLRGLNSAAVLDAILAAARRCREEDPAVRVRDADSVAVLIAVHLDEYQFYIKAMQVHTKNEELSLTCIKKMLGFANDWARGAETSDMDYARESAAREAGQTTESEGVETTESDAGETNEDEGVLVACPECAFFPIVSGTPVAGVGLEVTDKLLEVSITPGRFDLTTAAALVADVMTLSPRKRPVLARVRPEVLAMLTTQEGARLALSDTDFRPRYLVYLGVAARRQLSKTWSTSRDVYSVDWSVAINNVLRRVGGSSNGRYCEVLVLLALSQAPVRLVPISSTLQLSEAEEVVQRAARVGDVEVVYAGDDADLRTVRMPLVQLRKWGLASSLAPSLVNMAVCSWTQVEGVLAYCLRAKLYPGLRSLPMTSQDIFPGALGVEQVPVIDLLLDKKRRVYQEVFQFASSTSPVPDKQMKVKARIADGGERELFVDLRDGILMTCPGTMAVDLRFSVPMSGHDGGAFHVVVQTKHPKKTATTSAKDIRDWYISAVKITEKWRTGNDKVLYVFITNKRLSTKAKNQLGVDFFRANPFLCVVTADQLEAVVPPFLSTRFLTAAQQQRLDDESSA